LKLAPMLCLLSILLFQIGASFNDVSSSFNASSSAETGSIHSSPGQYANFSFLHYALNGTLDSAGYYNITYQLPATPLQGCVNATRDYYLGVSSSGWQAVNMSNRQIVDHSSALWSGATYYELWIPLSVGVGDNITWWTTPGANATVTGSQTLNLLNQTIDCWRVECVVAGVSPDPKDLNETAWFDKSTGHCVRYINNQTDGYYDRSILNTNVARMLDVPFYYQDEDYYCGPACLQMVFNFHGENISQYEIACVARSIGDPVYSTFTDELRRAGHFSNLSTSMGEGLPQNITGYTLRHLGYAAFECYDMNLSMLESYIDQGKPLVLLMWYSSRHVSGHYRVVTGYNATHVFLHDPWNKPLWGGTYGGPNTVFNNTQFMDLWSYSSYWTLYVSPWKIDVSTPEYVRPGQPFQVNSTIVYPEPLPNALFTYPASSCNASITLPSNMSLAEGEVQRKTVGTGIVDAGTNTTVTWTLVANSSVTGTMNITVEGLISGSVWTHENYTAYDYNDTIGATSNFTITLKEDSSSPAIGTPSRVPDANVQPDQDVKVSANVTDPESGVQNVTLFYTIDNGTTWDNQTMNLNESTGLYEATIPGQQAGTWVRFKIFACDGVGNNATLDGTAPYSIYQVIPEFPSFLILLLFVMATPLAVALCRKRFPRSFRRQKSAAH